jgi:hypothetical protein
MTDFLQGLEVRLADRFSIAPVDRPDGLDFEVVPFSGRNLDARESDNDPVDESQSELTGLPLETFQKRLRTRGALAAYRVGEGNYLVVDRAAKPVLEVMTRMQNLRKGRRLSEILGH